MNPTSPQALDLRRVRVFPLVERRSLATADEILVDPKTPPPACPSAALKALDECAEAIRQARRREAAVLCIFGAHLVKNGAALILGRLMDSGWLTHLATNGASSIHDWEFAYLGRSTESVAENVAHGCFGTWDETGRYLHLALLAGGIRGEGYGEAVGRFIAEDGTTLPSIEELSESIRLRPGDPLSAARADLLSHLLQSDFQPGRTVVQHSWKRASIFASAFARSIPLTVHPGIGYDIISNHPVFDGAAIGRAAALDFRRFGASVARLEGGVVLSIGSAIMGPQVFEKSLSCVNNLRLQEGRSVLRDHSIVVVDLQEGGHWDWSRGEPPKTSPAYYLRFCKSYSRMGGRMSYICCDNVTFLHHLHHRLSESS